MSHIDSYDHEYIGQLGYLPIYRPLETIKSDKWGSYDFGAHPGNLVLGGGSGEHPGLVVHKLESLVAKFLYDQLTEEDDEIIAKADRDYLFDLIYTDEIFEFCEWSIDHYVSLKEMAQSLAFLTPLSENEKVEDWLAKSLGELIFFSLSELNPEHEKLSGIFSPFEITWTMRNVTCVPPGYPACGGRRVIDGKLYWGLHRWNVNNFFTTKSRR